MTRVFMASPCLHPAILLYSVRKISSHLYNVYPLLWIKSTKNMQNIPFPEIFVHLKAILSHSPLRTQTHIYSNISTIHSTFPHRLHFFLFLIILVHWAFSNLFISFLNWSAQNYIYSSS